MISPKLRTAIESIRPMLDQNLAATLNAQAAGQPRRALSLGSLDDVVLHYGLIRGSAELVLRRKGLIAFASDHGVAAEAGTDGQARTAGAVRQFLRGGSAAQVLCRHAGIEPLLVNVGLSGEEEPGGLNFPIAPGTANIVTGAAMSAEQANAALEIGLQLAAEAAARFDVAGLAQIGAGGSIAAAALLSAMSGRDSADTTPHNPGDSGAGHASAVQCTRTAVTRHQAEAASSFGNLRSLGGLDIAAMTGFLLGAARHRLPVVIDGFVAGVAAVVARAMAPDSLDTMIFSHRQPSAAHAFLLQFLSVEPLLSLRISEADGFGAALAIQTLESAILLHREITDLSGAV
ncbi:MAG: nicotinate-nucleotide--dimethylbenzimidazole phosphoribosyltransferase [Bryobacterales bacterium]|nr:nicotinate-nucleotide--dimethylbenzimidazole phosphoribosyltransferase [Bryobacterales bacterium]